MDFQIVIIGGGPAGLITGFYLLTLMPQLRERIVLLEARKYPDPKPCGGAITPEGVNILEKLGMKLTMGVPFSGVKLVYNGVNQYLPGKGEGRVIKRGIFDKWLAENVQERGLKLFENCRVFSIKREKEKWILETACGKLSAIYLVGADGVNGITRKIIPPRGKISPLRKKVVKDREKAEAPIFDFSISSRDRKGYLWKFPVEEGMDTGIYLFSGKMSSRDKKDFSIGYAEHLYSPWNQMWDKGIILTGERIGVDPLLGEGIAPALEMGILAARALAFSIKGDRLDFPHYYHSFYSSFTGKKFRFNMMLANMLYGKNYRKWLKRMVESRYLPEATAELRSYGEIYRHPIKLLMALVK